MSMACWMIRGVGLDTREIEPYLNRAKIEMLIREQFPNDQIDYQRDIDSLLYDECMFDNLAEVLCCCDDSNTMTYDLDGDGGVYFLYPPTFPWDRRGCEPKSIEEAVKNIIKAVQKITDMQDKQIDEIIDENLNVIVYD